MTYEELKIVICNNTEASWQEQNIIEALEEYRNELLEQLEESSKIFCREYTLRGEGSLLYLPDAIEIVKGEQNE